MLRGGATLGLLHLPHRPPQQRLQLLHQRPQVQFHRGAAGAGPASGRTRTLGAVSQGRVGQEHQLSGTSECTSVVQGLPTEVSLTPSRPCLAQVTDLLKGKGVDLDNNRFLILQVGPRGAWGLAGFAHRCGANLASSKKDAPQRRHHVPRPAPALWQASCRRGTPGAGPNRAATAHKPLLTRPARLPACPPAAVACRARWSRSA